MKAFLKKEWMEWIRTGRALILVLVFTILGIMNPAFAKLTPWLMEMMSDSLSEAGFITTAVQIDAMTSWTQFYKNIPAGLIVFLLLNSSSFTAEYEKGTLIPAITRGLPRRKILAAKSILLFGSWTLLYALCFGITYGYNAYFWDNTIAGNLYFAAACTWLFGMWTTALLILFSSISKSGTQVLLGTGGAAMGSYLLSLFPKLNTFLPAKLMEGMKLLQKTGSPEDYLTGAAVSGITILLFMALSIVFLDKRQC
jgi:ABC-2 type transport system permease protein